MFDFIKLPFGYLLEWLIDFTGNYGVAILLFSLIVKLILLPASAKSKKAMMKQSRLAPQLKELELACGDDKAKYQQETMRLYKEEGVSMTGGVGKPWGVVIGCLLITVIANGLDIMGVSSHWQKIVKGVIIVVAVLIDVKGKAKKN